MIKHPNNFNSFVAQSKAQAMLVFPNAKINLGLNIVAKRADGFHNIETAFYPIGWSDVLEVLPYSGKSAKRVHFSSSGIDIPGKSDENLCVKAYQLIAQDYDLAPVKIHLHKIIPIGAGLGGGSSDAAFFIKALNQLFELNLAFGEMHHYARQLGSDCSFFINNKPSFAIGKGDEMEFLDIDLKGKFLLLVKPDIHVNTAMAYSGVQPRIPKDSLEENLQKPIEQWSKLVFNQFEATIFPKFPEIKAIKELMYNKGAVYAAMSGSGSSVFGIFEQEVEVPKEFKSHAVWCERLLV